MSHIGDDAITQITTNYKTLGTVQSTSETTPNNDWLLITVPEADPHSAPAQDPNLAYARNWACLSDLPLTPAPKITAIAPTTGPVGTTITLSGQNLSGTRAVLVGGLSVPFSQVSSSQVTATINATGNSGQVLLITNGGNAPAPKNFTVTAGLTAISPTSGAVGTPVNLNGFGLSSATAVKFNGVKVPFNVVSDSQLVATVSSGTNTGTVNVAVPTGTITSSLGFTVLPTLSSFSPTSGPVGSTVTLTGSGFTGVSSVQFGSLYAAFNFLSDTQIAVTVPAGVSTSTIKVTVGGASVTSSARFSVVNSPTITSFSPPSGGVGTSVTINGSNLGATSSVLFNGVAAAPASAFNNSVRVVVPSGAKSGPITVVNAAGSTTSASSFQIYAAPAISSFTPTSGPAGTAVTINGSHFTGTTAVSVGRTSAASFTVKSDSQITATVAANTPTGPLKITNPGGTATSSSYFQVK